MYWEHARNDYYDRLEKKLDTTWGKRGDVLHIGKTIEQINYHRGRKIQSARNQIDLFYKWLLDCQDRRTRVVCKAWLEEKEKTDEAFWLGFSDVIALIDVDQPFKQRFYEFKQALRIMKKITEGRESQYLLTNPVYARSFEIKNNYGKRTIDRLTEMHVLYTEIDHYKVDKYKHLTAKQVVKLILKKLDEKGFPRPTEIVYSRGPQLYWKHSPIPSYMLDEWRTIMKYINNLLEEFGADAKATDPVRVLRAVGSVHEKTGEIITGDTFSKDRFDFMYLFNRFCHDEWQEYLLEQENTRKKRLKELEKKYLEKQKWLYEQGIIDQNGDYTEKYNPTKKRKKKRINTEIKSHRYNTRHQNIINGLFWLSDEVRNGYMEGCREFSCYLVKTMAMRVTGGNVIESNRIMKELFDSFSIKKYSWEEILQYTKSSEDDYKRWSTNETTGVKYRTDTLIGKLKITHDEMKKMRFIVDNERSKELNQEYWRNYQKERYQKELREKGKITKKEEKEFRAKWIKYYLKSNPEATQTDIAKQLNVHKSTISRLIKEFKIEL